jgi:hypothetical protein
VVVARAEHRRATTRRCLALWAIVALLALASPTIARPQRSSSAGMANRGSMLIGLSSQLQVFDPAESSFFSLLTDGAMQQIVPTLFGDFQSPTALSMGQGLSGPMSQNSGLDPAVSAMLDQASQQLQPALQPSGGSAEVEEFGVGSDPGVGLSDPSKDGVQTLDKTPRRLAGRKAVGLASACLDQSLKDIQTGDRFWDQQSKSAPPAEFPRGIASGTSIRDPLGDLGPRGNPINLSSPGLAGDWCRPTATPFYETSPLEDHLLWIASGLLLTGVLVFYLSRGFRLPA